MKPNKVLKSLDELSPELIGSVAANTVQEPTTPEQLPLVKGKKHQIFQPVSFLSESEIRAYRGWGINE